MPNIQPTHSFDFDKTKVPISIRNDKQWVCWNSDINSKSYKVPINPETNRPAKSNDPNTWSTLNNTILCAKHYGYGIGYMFSNNNNIIGIDIDHCIENDKINKEAQEIIDLFNSYTEYSPSGKGIHILTKGNLPNSGIGRKNTKENIEIYTKGRYFTFTGNQIDNNDIVDSQASINALFNKLFKDKEVVNSLPPQKNSISLSSTDIIEKIRQSSQAHKFDRLYSGDTSEYPSASEADAAMCSILAFYTKDTTTIFNIIRNSGLMRDKWNRHDYRERTINNSLNIITEVYTPKKSANKTESTQTTLKDNLIEWINMQETGEFRNIDLINDLNIPRGQNGQLSRALKKLVSDRIIERINGKVGNWRIVEKAFKEMDFVNIVEKEVPIILPFGIHKIVRIMGKNIIIIAGAPDAGKTAFLLNVIKDNMNTFDIRYYNSEMGESELNLRLKLFEDLEIHDWHFTALELNQNFQDAIDYTDFDKSNKYGTIHIVDYLEIYQNHYIIGELIDKIYRKMRDTDITIIAIQKRPGDDYGRGGITTIEKARLALAIDRGNLRIIKAKNWTTKINPTGKQVDFKLVNGCKLIPTGENFEKQIVALTNQFL